MFSGMLNYISALRVNEVKTLMVLPPGDISSYYADPNLLSGITTISCGDRTYSSNTFRGDPVGIKTFILEGLDAPRVSTPHLMKVRTRKARDMMAEKHYFGVLQ